MFFKNKQEVTDPTTKKKKNHGMRLKIPKGYRRGIDPKKGIRICSD